MLEGEVAGTGTAAATATEPVAWRQA